MALNTVYEPLDFATGYTVTDETYTNVGASKFGLGDPSRPFGGLTVSTGAGGGGTVLVLNTDYTLETDTRLTTEAGFTVYASITVTNATYQTGTLYFNYTAYGSYIEWADLYLRLNDAIATKRYVNLTAINGSNPTYEIDVAVDAIQIGNIRETSFSATFDITASVGAGGLDAGTEANSTWYYIYAIAGAGETSNVMGSTNASTPTLPSGFTEYQLVSTIYNDGSGDFRTVQQINNKLMYSVSYGAVTAATYQTVASGLYYPDYTTVESIVGSITTTSGSAANTGGSFSPTSSGLGSATAYTNNNTYIADNYIVHPVSNNMYIKSIAAGDSTTVSIQCIWLNI